MAEKEFWTILATSSVVAAAVTVVVNRILKGFDEMAQRSAIKRAVQAEIDLAADFAINYLDPRAIRAPMHRITTALYDKGLAQLVTLGALSYECTHALLVYYNNVEQMNRSLGLLMEIGKDMGKDGAVEAFAKESRRAYLKAASLVPNRVLLDLLREPAQFNQFQLRSIALKHAKYRGVTPFDRLKSSFGLV